MTYDKEMVTERPSHTLAAYHNPANVQNKLHSDAEHIFNAEWLTNSQTAYNRAVDRLTSF